jgi:hypothetical protein
LRSPATYIDTVAEECSFFKLQSSTSSPRKPFTMCGHQPTYQYRLKPRKIGYNGLKFYDNNSKLFAAIRGIGSKKKGGYSFASSFDTSVSFSSSSGVISSDCDMCNIRVNRYKIVSVYSSSVHIQVNFSFVITYKIMFCQVLILIQLYVIMNKRAKQ